MQKTNLTTGGRKTAFGILALVLFTFLLLPARAQKVSPETKEENNRCLRCHANRIVHYKATGADKEYRQKMYRDCIIDTAKYYSSNHYNFKCIDCHSADYDSFPHNPLLRFEEMPGCLDCHGDDPNYAKYHFEQIQEEFEKSVHSTKHSAEFSCWSCHDSHYYKINARNRNQDLDMTIAYDNAFCLGCHANLDNYQMIANRLNPNVTTTHEWLPNQANHFKKVRCIECHGQINDSLLVAHLILPKTKAVKKCVECHSADSRLKASLYKFRLESGSGIFKDETIGNAVLIGSTRSTTVNLLSNFLIIIVAAGLIFHSVMRFVNRKKNVKHG